MSGEPHCSLSLVELKISMARLFVGYRGGPYKYK